MQIEETKLSGCLLITPKIFADERGYFMETYRKSWMDSSQDFSVNFVQENQSLSYYGTIRGLHFQEGEHAQAKLIRVLQGTILDVVVDIRKGSKTYGQHIAVELSSANHHQLWIPKGFAHGFSVLSDDALVSYKCDAYYSSAHEKGINPFDSTLKIDWHIPKADQIISKKDKVLPELNNIRS